MPPSKSFIALFLCAFMGACAPAPSRDAPAATAQTATAAPVETAGNPADDSARVVCVDAAPTGSRIRSRTCKTAAEWERIQRNAREGIDKAQIRAVQTGNPTGS